MRRYLIAGLCFLAGAVALGAAFRPYTVATGSMEDTIHLGEFLLVQKWGTGAYGRGDLAVVRMPAGQGGHAVKRIAGVAGDRIRIENRKLVLNGKVLEEPHAKHVSPYTDDYRDNFPVAPPAYLSPAAIAMLRNHTVNGEVVVPPGKYFVLGDNRDNSLDSRYWGFTDAADLMGKPALVYYARSGSGEGKWTFRRLR